MKKITLLFILLTASFSFGQVVLTEDFEAGTTIPSGWTNNDIAAASDTWAIETGGEAALAAAGNTLIYTNGGADGNYAAFDSGNSNNGLAEDVALESPVFSCVGLTAITFQYSHLFAGNFGGSGFVEVTNDGTTWTTLETYTADGYQGGVITLDASAELAGAATAQVRFRWTGDYSVAWYIDNVSVFECTVAAPDAVTTPTPADAAVDVAINTNAGGDLVIPFSWVEATTGGAADSFNFSIGITNTGDDIGTLNGVASGTDIIYTWEDSTLYYWRVDAVNCAGVTMGTVYSFTTGACTDTAPNPVTTPEPANGAPAVEIVINADGTRTITPFSWVDSTTGDPGTSFIINIGITNTGDDLGSLTNATNGNGIIYTWEYDTLYYWRVDAENCAGTTNGTVWSFTTAAFAGDSCADPIGINIGEVSTGDTSLASASGTAAGSCAPNGADEDLWFSFVTPPSGDVTVSCNADHVIIYSDCAGTEEACYTDANEEELSGLNSGTTYYARAYNTGTAKVAGPIAILISESILSTPEFGTKSLFTYFPNPVENVLKLSAQQNISNVVVFNMIGQEVLRLNPETISSEVDLSNMNSGAYFVKVTVGKDTETIRIIKN